jgi:acyl-CoA synthetase (AMP-forming)/AMP-acid ligase II
MNLGYVLHRSCEIFAENVAIISGDEQTTFHEVGKRTNRLVNGLFDLGLRKGDRVGLLLKNCKEALEVYLALIKGGFVRVPINVRLSPREVTYILRDSGLRTHSFQGCPPSRGKIKEELPELTLFVCIEVVRSTLAMRK